MNIESMNIEPNGGTLTMVDQNAIFSSVTLT